MIPSILMNLDFAAGAIAAAPETGEKFRGFILNIGRLGRMK